MMWRPIEPPEVSESRTWLAVAVTLCAMVFAAMQGLTYPLLALILHRQGAPVWSIGLNAAAMPLGMIAAAFQAPRLNAAVGGWRLSLWSLTGCALGLLLIGAFPYPLPWLPLRFGLGFCLGCLLVLSEAWINEISSERHRARVVGLFSALLSAGFAAGPLLLLWLGSAGWAPFVAGATLPLVSIVALMPVRASLPSVQGDAPETSILRFLAVAPLLVLTVAVVGFADEGAMSLLPVYAVDHGYGEGVANGLLIVMIAGSVMLQFPFGWLADRWSRTGAGIACAALAALSAALLPLAAGAPALLGLCIFIWGGAYYAVYVLSLVRLGQRFSGHMLIVGNAAFGAVWGLGGLIGPLATGVAMTAMGRSGLPVVFAALFAAITVFLLVGGRRAGGTRRHR